MSAPTIGGKLPLATRYALELLALPHGWAGNKTSVPVSAAALITLGGFSVVPRSNGGLQLEVHRDGFDIEIEIGPEGHIENAFLGKERKL